MSNFRVGQKVVCVRGRKSFGHPYDLCNWPEKGDVYTVKTINDHGYGKVLITVVELDNSHMVPEYSRLEPGFPTYGFRPVAEPGTGKGMSILRDLLNKADKPVEVDA